MSEQTLSPAQQKLLERLRQGKPGKVSAAAAISDGPAPLSFAQQRLWFLEQLLPRADVYTQPFGLLLEGKLDIDVLERCIREIVRRHEPLRTTFPVIDGKPVQRVADIGSLGPILEREDISRDAHRQDRAIVWLRAEARRSFDLARGPLFSARILTLAKTEHLLVFNVHHIVSDTWSFGVLLRELGALYPAFARHMPSPLPPVPMRYADFARAQHEQARGPALAQKLAHWKTKLGKAPPVLDLLGDRPRPPRPSYAGGLVRFRLDGALSAELARSSQRHGVTLFMTLLAAFQSLLFRYTQQSDTLIGTTVAGRSRPELEPLFGFFANTVVLRTDLSGDPTFRELLERVRTTVLEANDHHDLPFELLVNEYQLARDVSHNPLFQINFVLQNAPLALVSRLDRDLVQTVFHPQSTETHVLHHSEVELDSIELYNETAKFDLWLSMVRRESGLAATIEYNSDRFDRATIERMAAHFEVLLKGIVSDPDSKIGTLPILTEREHRQLASGFGAPAALPCAAETIHARFEAQAARSPKSVALSFEDQTLTYEELNARANRLAHHLRELGVGPDVLVGVCLERSLDMVVTLLAVLKAGGAYVPLDPTYPKERIAFMLEDSRCAVVVTPQRLAEDAALIANQSSGNPAPRGSSLAYVIYTSGSTGKPKGVLVSHANVMRLFSSTDAWFTFGPDDVWTLFHSYAFDFSVWEIWGALLHGGKLVVVPYLMSRSPEAFHALLVDQGVTVLNQTPSAFRLLMAVESERSLSLRLVIFGGEALEIPSLRPWFAKYGDRKPQLVNMYGITETTVHVTYRPLTIDDLETKGSVIGRPIPDLRVYLLDRRQQPVPIGIPGEIYVGGAGVALGYLHRPQLTAERFLADPFSEEPGARMYRSGDLGRYGTDGQIEYLGRIDQQVKIRGFRIELGEIEAALRNLSTVEDVVVQGTGDQLVAYVVPHRNARAERTFGQREHVRGWEAVFDGTYRPSQQPIDPENDFRGWNSSYTGLPLSDEAMHEWVNATVARIRALCIPAGTRPRILELGCGTGLLLFRLAPDCQAYHATDLSNVTIETLEAEVRRRGLAQVELAQKEATDVEPAPELYDVVILNSVIQYFPSIEYLQTVLERAARVLRPGGAIFMGDVRSLPLLELFHASVQSAKAPCAPDRLRQRIRHDVAHENELVIDPAFFWNVHETLDSLGCERVLCKRGRHRNEMTLFRYDVVLRRAPHLPSQKPFFELTGVADARLASEHRALESFDPEDLFALGDEFGYDVDVVPRSDAPGTIDVRFRHPAASPIEDGPSPPCAPPLAHPATQPLRERLTASLVPIWRKELQRTLPDFMIPSVFVLMDAIPMDAHGKVHRSALPTPATTLSEADYVAPRSQVETILSDIWADVLGLDAVGIENDFFALGGDSIRSIQVIARARRAGLNLTVEQLFRNQTISALAAAVSGFEPPQAPVRSSSDDVEGVYPVSPMQAYMIHRLQTHPEPGLYALSGAAPIRQLHIASFLRAWQVLIERHPALRTSFIQSDSGRYMQVVHRQAELPIEEHDWRDVPPDAVESRLHAAIQSSRMRGYRLDECPQMRLQFFRVDDEVHWVSFEFNYLQRDGWSTMIVLKELQALYEAFTGGGAVPSLERVPSPRAYIDWVQRQDAAATEAFWRNKLRGFRRPTPLAAKGTPDDLEFTKQPMRLPRSTRERLDALSREERITFNTLVHGAWALLLAETTGSDDVLYGAVVSGRTPEIDGIEGMVGLFNNVLPVRPPLPSRFPTLRSWLRALQDDFLELRRYEHSSLLDVRRWSELPEKARFFDSYIVLENMPIAKSVEQGLDPSSPFSLAQLDFPLRVEVWPGLHSELLFVLYYYRRYFEDGTIAEMLQDLERVLTFMPRALDQPPRFTL